MLEASLVEALSRAWADNHQKHREYKAAYGGVGSHTLRVRGQRLANMIDDIEAGGFVTFSGWLGSLSRTDLAIAQGALREEYGRILLEASDLWSMLSDTNVAVGRRKE